MAVWQQLREIPYGQAKTYRELAQTLHSSPRAIGNAVGRNPISIIIPCHRILNVHQQMTGYAGGIARKQFLLELEGIPFKDWFYSLNWLWWRQSISYLGRFLAEMNPLNLLWLGPAKGDKRFYSLN